MEEVKFNFEDTINPSYALPDEPVRFCQAIKIVKETSTNLQLNKDTLSCKAAKYIFGLDPIESLSEAFDNLVAEKRFNHRKEAENALTDAPRMIEGISSVLLSASDYSPDVFVLYLKPVNFMLVVQAYQKMHIDPINLIIPSIVPVCGGCAVASYLSQQITASFGCEDSREHGGITEDKLVMGIPYSVAGKLARTLEVM